MSKTLRWCPNCEEEVESDHQSCPYCGDEFHSGVKVHVDEFSSEDEWTESDWGEDVEQLEGSEKTREYGISET